MTHQRSNQNVDQMLSTWMNHAAPDRAPARLLESTFVRTMQARQARVYPWHRLGTIHQPAPRLASRPTPLIALLLLVIFLVLAIAAGLVGGGLHEGRPPTPTTNVTPPPSPSSSPSPIGPAPISVAVEATIAIQEPIALSAADLTLWVLSSGRIDRIDPITNVVTGSVTLGSASDLYNGGAANASGVWATNWDASVVYRVDPLTLKVVATVPNQLAKGVLITDDGLWLANTHAGTVTRIDPRTNEVSGTVSVGPTGVSGPNWLADGQGSIWVDVPNNGTIARIDPVTLDLQAAIRAPLKFTPCGGMAVGADAVWVTSCDVGTSVARLDPTSNTPVTTVEMGGHGYSATLIAGAPWVAIDTGSPEGGRLLRINPLTNAIDRVLIPSSPFGGGGDILVIRSSVWVVDGYHDQVMRLPLVGFGP